jgi:hypothetical protein
MPPSKSFHAMSIKELRAEAARMKVDLTGCVEKEEMIWKLEAALEDSDAAPSEAVGQWTRPQMKGFLLKDATISRSNTKRRYFTLLGNFMMYYEDANDSVFKPKGIWCLDDCKKGLMKRPGLSETQARGAAVARGGAARGRIAWARRVPPRHVSARRKPNLLPPASHRRRRRACCAGSASWSSRPTRWTSSSRGTARCRRRRSSR